MSPQPIERLAFLRITLPLAILGFMSSRIAAASHWIGQSGFSVPDLGRVDYRQPLYLHPLPDPLAWALSAVMVASGLCLAAGVRTRASGAIFALTIFYVALADRLAAFTVSKIGGVLVLALAVSAAGTRYGYDAWARRRAEPDAPLPTHAVGWEVLFFQAFISVLYAGSGICKYRGEWAVRNDILWTHLHDSYQTSVSHWLANILPAGIWPILQWSTLIFEIGAPLWFLFAGTRPLALIFGLVLHAMIGLLFGPIVWFSLLMMSLLIGCFAPAPWLRRLLGRVPG